MARSVIERAYAPKLININEYDVVAIHDDDIAW